jgi:NADH-quinone oxidoreductase subunit G
MATVYVNGAPVDIGNERLNCVQAAERAGVLIPHYCWHPALTVVASCRMCLIEVGDMKDGKPVLQPKVVPGCQTPVKDGTVIVTNSEKAKAAQAQTLEGLLLNHPLDCPVCDKAGECLLQDYSYEFGNAKSRMIDGKNQPPNKPDISPTITLFTDRCIMCTRCVRFTREISGTAELQVTSRGDHSEIDVFPGEPLDNKLAGNVVDLCPVGALGSKDFLYKQRVWYLKSTNSVCPNCSTGCSVVVDTNKDVVFRLRPRYNPQAQGHFMCDEGRYGYHYIDSAERFLRPLCRLDGHLKPTPWARLLPVIRKDFSDAARQNAEGVFGVFSPFLTAEEAFLLAKYVKGLSASVRLALGPVPVVGEDDVYPKDRRGNPPPPDQVKFTIRAEKCPNRRGVEAVLRHFQGEVIPFGRVLEAADRGEANAVFLTAGYARTDWLSAEDGNRLAKVPLLLTIVFFAGPATASAKYVLPATAFAEKEGTFVNHAGLAQAIQRCSRPPQECRSEGQVFLDLMERRGLLRAGDVRKELATEMPYFASLAGGLGDYGAKLDER